MTNPLLEQKANSAGDLDTPIPARFARHGNLARGIAAVRLPSQTRAVMETLLPRGAELLEGLCTVAVEKRYECSSLGDVATLIPTSSITSIADLARQIQWGYDTLNAYIVVLCAFGILRKCKHGRQVELWLPLESGYAPDPDKIIYELRGILDPERGYRDKVRGLVASALANFIRLYPSAGGMEEIKRLLLSACPDDITEAAASLEHFLTISEIEEIRIGSLHIFRGSATPSSRGRPGTQSVELKDSVGTTQPRTCQNLPGNTDSVTQQDGNNATESRQYGDSVCSTEPGLSQNLPELGDSVKDLKPSRSESSKGTRFQQRHLGAETPESPNPPSSKRDSGNEELLPVTGNKHITNKTFYSEESGTGEQTTSNERQDSDEYARILASLLENTDAQGAIKSYCNLLEQFGERIAAAALIATLVRKSAAERMGPLTKPGGYFTQRCRKYAANGIPGEILAALDRYGGLPLSEIEDRIRADVQGQPLQAGTTSPSFTKVHRQVKPMTTREQVEALRKRIASDDPTVTVHPARGVSSPSGVEYVVDIELDGHLYTLATLEDWDSHYRAVQELITRLRGMGDRVSTCAVT